MAIEFKLDVVMADRKVKLKDLAEQVGMYPRKPFEFEVRKSKGNQDQHTGINL